MKIKWLGHSSFLITAGSGFKIITDPYLPDSGVRHGEIKETADVVTISHEHTDHNNSRGVRGNPVVLRKSAEVKGINFHAVAAFHDNVGGRKRGSNTVFCFAVDGINICHMGDLGNIPEDRQISDIGKVDVLLIPVGGFFTLELAEVDRVIEKIKPRIVFPMHYKTEKVGLPISGVDRFLEGKQNVSRLNVSEVELKADAIPAVTTIMVLKPAL